MATVPHSQEVSRAIRNLKRNVKTAIKKVNQQAAKRLSRGHYSAAQEMMDCGQAIGAFAQAVTALESQWRQVRSHGRLNGNQKPSRTPMWEYYGLILQTLVALGGAADRDQIEQHMEGEVSTRLKEADLATNSQGLPRWKQIVRRARKHMIAEGFLSKERGQTWKITKKGEHAATASPKEPTDS